MNFLTNCPSQGCGGFLVEKLVFYSPDQYEHIVGVGDSNYRRSWSLCSVCGIAKSFKSYEQPSLDRIYEDGYRDVNFCLEDRKEKINKILRFPREESEIKTRIAWITDSINDEDRSGISAWNWHGLSCLDVGGGSLAFAAALARLGAFSAVCDPDEGSSAVAPFFNVSYHTKRFDDLDLPVTKFDFLSLNFVLEHIEDPWSMIALLKNFVAPGGFVYIEVPDSISLEKDPVDHDTFNSCHLWLFSLFSVVSGCHNHAPEFEVVACSRHINQRGYRAVRCLLKLEMFSE